MIKRSDENQRDKREASIDEDSSIVSGRSMSMAQIAEDRDTSWTSQDDQSNENKSRETSNQDSIHWVRTELVIDVAFTQRTRDERLRHPSFRGLREDRNPQEIRMSRNKPSAAIRQHRL